MTNEVVKASHGSEIESMYVLYMNENNNDDDSDDDTRTKQSSVGACVNDAWVVTENERKKEQII